MADVSWQNAVVGVSRVFFNDLDVNASFRIKSNRSRGAVYRKVYYRDTEEYFMMEEATGKLFDPTTSEVEEIYVSVDIDAGKPNIY